MGLGKRKTTTKKTKKKTKTLRWVATSAQGSPFRGNYINSCTKVNAVGTIPTTALARVIEENYI